MIDVLRRFSRSRLALASLAMILFNNWLLGLAFNWELIKKGGSISELSSPDQPAHWLFQSLDIAAGIMILVLAYSLKDRLDLKRRSGRWLVGSSVLLGAANIADAFMPLPCSGTLDRACDSPVHLGLHGFSIPTHAISSTIIGVCFLALPILSLIYYRLQRRITLAAFPTLLATLIFFIFLFAESAKGSYSGSTSAGYSQEVQMLMFGAWLIFWAKSLTNLAR